MPLDTRDRLFFFFFPSFGLYRLGSIDRLILEVEINNYKNCMMFHGIVQMLIFYSFKPQREVAGTMP